MKNEPAAARIAASLLVAINKLKAFPQWGTIVKKAKSQLIRDLLVDDYIVRYLITEKSIYILRVWHHKEDWKQDGSIWTLPPQAGLSNLHA